MKRARRVLSHHGSDCPDGPHPFKSSRCIILTRIDRPGKPSEAWVSGDCAETIPRSYRDHKGPSERIYRKRHTFKSDLPVHYGGGFWQYVEIPPIRDFPINLTPTEEEKQNAIDRLLRRKVQS